jgi:hypothetical protein
MASFSSFSCIIRLAVGLVLETYCRLLIIQMFVECLGVKEAPFSHRCEMGLHLFCVM